jgi:PTH1 family peptidyl-tRNA hydrolase
MKLIVGLGNPGKKYINTRHNVGQLVLEALAKNQNSKFKSQNCNLKFKIDKKLNSEILKVKDLILAKPLTFMNESGKAVKKLVDRYKINLSNLWIIHDDLDLALGRYKIQKGRGPRLHKGIVSIEKELGTEVFWRVRVGIENREPSNKISGESYVLQRFDGSEEEILKKTIDKIAQELLALLK